MLRSLLIATFVVAAGCAQIPSSPDEMHAKKFESVPGKAVIYIVRPALGFAGHGSVTLDDSATITMFGGNFYRWEVAPGPHRIAGAGQDMSRLTLNAEAGKIYFVRHQVLGSDRTVWGWGGVLELLPERDGRMLVQRARLLGNG
jgi:hypothetical protein